MTDSPNRARSEVVRVDESVHLPVLRDFIREVWTPTLEIETLRDARQAAASVNPADPGQAPPTFLFLLDGRAVGHLTTIPTRFVAGGREFPAHWLKGFWVLPEHRNGPIGALLVRQAARELDFILATVVDRAPLRVFEAFKIADRGSLTDFVRLLRPERVIAQLDLAAFGFGTRPGLRRLLPLARLPGIARIAGGLVRAGLAVRSARSSGTSDLHASGTMPSDDALTEHWGRVVAKLPSSPVRDGAYLRRMFHEESDQMVVVERAGEVAAWARLRRPRDDGGDPRMAGIRVATLSDVVVPPDRAADGLAVLRAAEDLAREMGADALLCAASHPSLCAWLASRAFVRVGARVHFAARAPRGAPDLPESAASCWLTRADGGADEGF